MSGVTLVLKKIELMPLMNVLALQLAVQMKIVAIMIQLQI